MTERAARLICVNCGEPVGRCDDGSWWHVTEYDGYVRCRLTATPCEEAL